MKRLCVALLVGFLWSGVPLAWADTLTVTTLNGLGTGSLRHAIERAADGDTIQFAVTGTITLIRSPLQIDKDLTIVGPGVDELAISGLGQRRVLEVAAGARVLITGLTFTQGMAELGGAILNHGNLTLHNSRVMGNWGTVDGGGVYNDQAVLIVEGSEFRDNAADGENASGGAIFNLEGVVEIRAGSVVAGNRARRDGGGVVNTRGDVTVDHSTLSDNTAGGDGGAIATVGDLTVTDSALTNNVAERGGALANQGVRPMAVSNSRLAGNRARGLGGAVFNNGNAPLALGAVVFEDNAASAGRGGALANINGAVEVDDGWFGGNSARDEGGAIYNEDVLKLNGSTFEGNASASGGALRNLGQVLIADSAFSDNAASQSGGALVNAGFGEMTLQGVTVRGNSAQGNGGGIANLGSATLIVRDSVIQGNQALGGGGLWNLQTLEVYSSQITGNMAKNGGGGLLNGGGGNALVVDTTVLDNRAEGDGGGMWNDGNLTVRNSTLSGNRTEKGLFGGGGAIWNALTGNLQLSATVCQANTEGGGRADVFNNGGTVANQTQCAVVG